MSRFMMPGANYTITRLLGLNRDVRMLYSQGCFTGATALHVAKDLAENNPRMRVLVVCAESTVMTFHVPVENRADILVGQASFSDGAAALLTGANLDVSGGERPLFEIVWAGQTIVPESDRVLTAHYYEKGMSYFFNRDMIPLFRDNIESFMAHAFNPLGISDWNSLFYAWHPGVSGFVDAVAGSLGVRDENFVATRHVLKEYGNMSSASVIFILDEIRRRSAVQGKTTTGDGKEFGCLIGLTAEVVVLRSFSIFK